MGIILGLTLSPSYWALAHSAIVLSLHLPRHCLHRPPSAVADADARFFNSSVPAFHVRTSLVG
ncbi:unnamed protein product [Sphenostylis stenocarpa]|uniref:Secreted protein n=1 Tax=Sphenostylis stenocarpa TaxID=92480 RepID=A0AA86S8V8_9FABA|nr:unnamed protein product [Sphenostylis stenocarpa]